MANSQKIALLLASVGLLMVHCLALDGGSSSKPTNQDQHDHHGAGCPKKTEGAIDRQRRQTSDGPLDQVQAGWKSATDFISTHAKSAQESISKSWDSLTERPKREEGIAADLGAALEGKKESSPLDQVQAGFKSATDFLGNQAKSAQESISKSWDSLTRPKRQSNGNPLETFQVMQSLQSNPLIQSFSGLLQPQPQGPPQSIDQTLPAAINREAANNGLPFSPAQLIGSLNNLVRSSQEGSQKALEGGQQVAGQAQSGITAAFTEIGQGLRRITEKNPTLLPDVKELYSNVASKFSSTNKQANIAGLAPQPGAGQQLADNLAKVQAPGFQPTA